MGKLTRRSTVAFAAPRLLVAVTGFVLHLSSVLGFSNGPLETTRLPSGAV
jgi:hypothetical protein